MTAQRARSHHATSQNPQDSRIDRGMIQDGKLRGFAMDHAIPVCEAAGALCTEDGVRVGVLGELRPFF